MDRPGRQAAQQNPELEAIADRAYAAIAASYPICCGSDEFYFFPQVVLPERDWTVWDDFSAPRISELSHSLQGFEQDLAALESEGLSLDDQVDAELLQQLLRTLREQLLEVAQHRTQPTFHLTVLAAGLADALASPAPEAWPARVGGVSSFLQRSAQCLDSVPVLFQKLGCDMLLDMQKWVRSLQAAGYEIGDMLLALQSFLGALQAVSTVVDYHLPESVLEKLVCAHVNCGIGTDVLLSILEDELRAMQDVLSAEASTLVPGLGWVDADERIPFVAAEGEDLLAIYRRELNQLESHCRHQGLVPEDMSATELGLSIVPDALAAVRASDAYAATPGFPPRGGVFYVMEEGRTRGGLPGRTLEYRMTAVHEAWPGHHLLDSCRWGLKRSIRRPIESPLFYEGWACLAEELMFRTGYFDGPWDRFLLARRRAERAARGMIDLGLQSGRMTIAEAIAVLVEVGYRKEIASSVVPKYLLRPGYQVCYTFGLKQGLALLDRFGGSDIGWFARCVLQQGEIGFSRLEKQFSAETKRSRM